ncbi:Formate dehydrogenase, nitrate-inducible, cytochrome b556(Fdn) subunit [Rhodobacteraceae bacterium THAF1]|uniref:formate dehydrogenase subunit gamma n=1 Tax=Palleronia sp. THAF1 TaxID=2587842 RepID=UPI000F3FAB6D|nr:formate dehydrogenase subunit gamma [Palleronia sp. THAF1]QFU10021.1 Formate dehydrogenase, nitrate-inducible, cytochrome b556(Fdn) subunit [Palleronia sp. THAF1]VDC17074.1 Formate dehydrogenase, nitrate-inducible, cytochrome b556(Fdn) subunit [Rhodobacteraceae bacterium THAF1]
MTMMHASDTDMGAPNKATPDSGHGHQPPHQTFWRIVGAIFALIFALLLVIQVFEIFDGDNQTVPEVRWGTPPISDVQTGLSGVQTEDILRDRATLQADRQEFGPSPDAPRTFQVGPEVQLQTEEIENTSPFLTNSWANPGEGETAMVRGTDRVEGVSSLPYNGAEIFERPFARDWRLGLADFSTHLGALAILGFAFLLSFFLAVRGRVPIASGRSSKPRVKRFGLLERATHWMTSASFLMLALTGIVIAYGDTLILPFGGDILGQAGWLATWGHMMFFPSFAIGVVLMFIMWVGRNLPDRYDANWLKKAGGMLSDTTHPSAKKFNAGQKLIFWSVILGGGALIATGIVLMFPFVLGINVTSWAMLAHAIIAVLMIAVILGHIYIGSVGMEGAFAAMWSGKVDRNWAAEHHDVWLAEMEQGKETRQ